MVYPRDASMPSPIDISRSLIPDLFELVVAPSGDVLITFFSRPPFKENTMVIMHIEGKSIVVSRGPGLTGFRFPGLGLNELQSIRQAKNIYINSSHKDYNKHVKAFLVT